MWGQGGGWEGQVKGPYTLVALCGAPVTPFTKRLSPLSYTGRPVLILHIPPLHATPGMLRRQAGMHLRRGQPSLPLCLITTEVKAGRVVLDSSLACV